VGNGPFELKQWLQKDRIVVARRTNYWDAAAVRLNGITFHPMEAKAEQRAFEADQLHITNTVEPQAAKFYLSKRPDLIRVVPYLGTYYYLFNTKAPPFDNPAVRRALSMAINREELVTLLMHGGEQPAYSFMPPNTGDYVPTAKIIEDVEAARALLAEAGFPGGQGFPRMKLLYNNTEMHQKIAEVVANMWQEQLGIDVDLTSMEWQVYLDETRSGKYEIARAAWIADYNDPSTFLDMWVTGGGNNRAAWGSSEYDRLIREAAITAGESRRNALFQEAETILLDESPIMPIYFYVSKSLIKPSVRGWYDNVLDHHPWKYIWLDPVK
jgi:oligopeptide transport system substrate-binding protein